MQLLLICAQSLLDDFGLADVNGAAEAVKQAVEQQQFQKATELWSVAEMAVEQVGSRLFTRGNSYGCMSVTRCFPARTQMESTSTTS